MQNLSNAFDLNKKYIYLKKRLFTLLLVMFVPVLSQAVVGSDYCHDTAANQYAILGDQYLPGPTNLDYGSVPKLSSMYHQVIIPADGNITLEYVNNGNKALTFSVGSNCDGINYDTKTINGGNSASSPLLNVSQGDILYIKILNGNTNAQAYHIKVNYASDVILASISPSEITVPQGITPVYLDVTLNRGSINGDLNVTYFNSYDNTTKYFLIDKWYDSYKLQVDINISDPDLVVGSEFNITLLSAVDTSGYEVGIITENNTSTIKIGDPMADLAVVKADSQDPVRLGESFYYTIAVSNYGTAPASNVKVVDTMPVGYVGFVDLASTNNASPGWDCELEASDNEVVCEHDGNITNGALSIIQIHLTVPLDVSLIGSVTNQAYVESDQDYDMRNDRDFENTRIVAQGYDEINQVVEMCYIDTTEDTMPETDFNKNCKKVGNFYYSNGCTATVDIIVDQNLTMPLSSVHLTKMYAPEIINGTCKTEQGICTGFQDIYVEESPSYTKGYEFEIGTLAADSNITITDKDSYNGNPNNPADLAGIGLYATYTYEGVYHFGRVQDCRGISESGVEITTYADAIDTEITNDTLAGIYNASTDTSYDLTTPPNKLKWIQTREASSQKEITGVHLDIDTLEATKYEYQFAKDYSDFIIIPLLVSNTEDNQCGLESDPVYDETGAPLVIMIPEGSYSAAKTMTLPNTVRRDARLQLIYIDPNTLSPEGRKCLSTSSTGGNLEGIGQCGNSEIQYVGGFGVDAWDRCGINNGSPCLSSHHGYSGGGNEAYPGYNPLYDNPLGCYMCTFNLMPACSTDNFAIRPAKLDMNMTDPDGPHLLRAGKQYNVSLTAKDALDNIADEYTVTDHNYNTDLGTEAVKYFSDGVRDIVGEGDDLSGISELNAATTAYMVAGLSSLTTSGPTAGNTADQIVGVYYSDVGFVGLRVYDQEWAEVDNDDTPMDCDSETHTYVCGENNVTFIPDRFDFSILNITNNGGPDNNFTYIANENNVMSAKVQTRIRALNALGTITRNFKEDSDIYKYYENNISVDMSVIVRTLDNPDANGNAYRYPYANESNISNQKIGFGRPEDINGSGTRDILWTETTYPLNFNFTRDQRREENPFDVNGSYLSIKVTSEYVDPTDGDSATIQGSRIGDENTSVDCASDPTCVDQSADGNATFLYGRTRSSKFFYEDITGPSVETPVAIYVYCNTTEKGYTWCDEHHVDTIFGQTSINNWWLSTDHISTRDGNVTLTVGPVTEGSGNPALKHEGAGEVSTLVIDLDKGVDKNISVIGHTTSRPMTVWINLETAAIADTAPWLIYNQVDAFSPPTPFYKVRFINTSGWTGIGLTGNVLETNASTEKTQRLDW